MQEIFYSEEMLSKKSRNPPSVGKDGGTHLIMSVNYCPGSGYIAKIGVFDRTITPMGDPMDRCSIHDDCLYTDIPLGRRSKGNNDTATEIALGWFDKVKSILITERYENLV